MTETSETSRTLNVWMLERRLSRAVAAVGLVVCVVLVLTSPSHQVPLRALMGVLGAYAAVKLVVLFLNVRAKTQLWPANLAEITALSVVGYVLWTGSSGPIWMLLIVALLLAGGFWRRRVTQMMEAKDT